MSWNRVKDHRVNNFGRIRSGHQVTTRCMFGHVVGGNYNIDYNRIINHYRPENAQSGGVKIKR